MSFGLTDAGFNKKRLIDIKTEIEAELKTSFGDNISLIPQSVFGEIVGIFSEREAALWDLSEYVYFSQYPSTAQGVPLSNVVMLNGIERQEATYSTVTLTLAGDSGTIIPIGTAFATSDTAERFLTDNEVTIGSGGTIQVTATAENIGEVIAVAGTVTVIVNPILGLTSSTNGNDATVGRDIETDAELRIRRELSTQALGQNLVDSLFGQLLNIDNVTDALVISNGLDVPDSNGIPAHQFLTVVEGGLEADIINAIWLNTPQGILSFGALSADITDSQGYPQTIKYSRPTEIDIYMEIDVITDATFPADGSDQIKSKVTDYGNLLGISDDVILSKFYTPINEVSGITSITLKIDTVSPAVGTSNIAIAIDEIAKFDTARVVVNVT